MIFRMTGDDLMPGSTTLDEVLAFAAALAEHVDALNIGVGWHESPLPTVQGAVPEGAFFPRAQAIKAAVGELPVIAGNRVAEHGHRGAAAARHRRATSSRWRGRSSPMPSSSPGLATVAP